MYGFVSDNLLIILKFFQDNLIGKLVEKLIYSEILKAPSLISKNALKIFSGLIFLNGQNIKLFIYDITVL